MSNTLSAELEWRQFIKQKTFDDNTWLDKPRTVYFGVDPTADSLHVGNLASYMPLRHMIDRGWNVILLVGGATGMIGDPGGKSEERNLLEQADLDRNKLAVEKQVKQLFAGKKFTLVDNYDWTKDVKLLEFLRDFGKHFSMTPLVQRDYIAQRIGEGGAGISYTEFSYTLLQGFDYWHLFKNYGCVLQYGGSDQWGNMISGVELIRRKEGKEAHVLAGPLIVDNRTGKKFGKSEGGAVWLDENKTSVNQFYQFWLNSDDGAVKEYLGYYTLLSQKEIEEVMKDFNNDRASRIAQKKLAFEVTKLVHGEDKAHEAKVYGDSLSASASASPAAPPDLEAKAGDNVVDILTETELAGSKTEARQLLQSGGVYINDKPVTEEVLKETDFIDGILKLRRGKKLQNTVFIKQK